MEKLIEDKMMKGEMSAGLFDTGLSHVLVDIAGDSISFRWFDHIESIEDFIEC